MQFLINKNLTYYIFIVLITLSLHLSFGFAKSNNLTDKSCWHVIKSTQDELVLSFTHKLLGFDTIYTIDGKQTFMPIIEGAFSNQTQPGIQSELISKQNISIPGPDTYQIEDIKVEGIRQYKGIISPVPDRIAKIEAPVYHINNTFYKAYKSNWVGIKYEGIARDRHIACLSVIASKYNPELNVIEIPERITITIKFKPVQSGQITSKSPDPLSAMSSINYEAGNNWTIKPEILRQAQNDKQYLYDNKKDNKDKIQAEGKWIKITIENEGIFKIDQGMLSSVGISIPKEEIPTIKIYGNGGAELSERVSDAQKNNLNEQEIIVKTNDDGNLSQILFYGSPASGFIFDSLSSKFSHYINHYSYNNYYLMTWGGEAGKRATAIIPASGEVKNSPLTYTNRIFFEEELYNAFKGNNGSGRTWFGGSLFPRTFRTKLNNLDRTGEIKYRISVAHRSDSSGYFSITENSKEIIKANLIPNYGKYVDATRTIKEAKIPASDIAADDYSTLKFSYVYPHSGTNSTPFFDYYEINYPRYFVPIDNEISFFTEPVLSGLTEFSVNGYSGSDILGFDITDLKSPKLLSNKSTTGKMFIFRENLDSNKPHRYYISSVIKTPKLELTEFGNIRQNTESADVILICHPSLYNSALNYKAYRESHDTLKVLIVRTDYIYNEFGSGIPDPTAIRDYIVYAFTYWTIKPSYVILWGDGHFDYKNISSNKTNYVLPYESDDNTDSFDAVASYTSDDYFARVFGDDKLVDIGIGRITIDSDELGDWIVNKIEKYETGSSKDAWRTWITLMADDSQGDGADGTLHSGQSEKLSNSYIPDDIRQKKIYLVEYPPENIPGGTRKPKVMQDMVSWVNTNGSLVLNWIGHGNPRVWAHEEVFEKSLTIPQLTNIDKLNFVVAATCDFGRFDVPETNSGAEELVNSKIGGAIGVLASTRAVLSGANASFTYLFYQKLFTRNPLTERYNRLGDVMFALKQEKYSDNDEKFLLIGDPTIKLLIPDYVVSIDSINEVDVSKNDTNVQIKALSSVHLSCSILNLADQTIASDFDGTAIISILDADVYIQALDIDRTLADIQKEGGALNINSAIVRYGKFEANCIIPKDISFSNQNGRIFVYANSVNGEFAKGISRSFVINGVDSTQTNDRVGPQIALYLDSRTFKPGDIVQKIPLLIVDLFDNSGINTTGLGIGHRIEAWIDDNPKAVDLTDKFVSNPGDFRAGSAEEFLFNLSSGEHTVKVRAWDVFNNYSIAQTNFRIIPEDSSIILSNILNFPNPADNITVFNFNHNITPPFFAEIKLYNVIGNEIADISAEISTAHTAELNWDCRDNTGDVLPVGIYYYRIFVETNKGYRGDASGKLTVSH
ncbi:MAG: hypothetical protein A2X61_11370 [Ignavibacteria bacterium GWB2_35_12]|nr:MAG: hypothetical protein A2X61_11370 [Ignavibacteria bacterium GWB2_35_12]OGU89777.1 MAG: hypothetical protein A2220_02935 [Ignavibacteria bacterium RIFOXYA2_FULL_35_10]OGV24034.1 MAG: hypothetical protein A2475_11015 [Ignavibacteria bacterium RIFOXYC2_FULL_35_21]